MMATKKASGETTSCPWCSAVVPIEAVTCPSCGAALRETLASDVPGVNMVDPRQILAQRKLRKPGLRALIGAADDETEGSPTTAKVEPPSDEVRKEMLRLKLAALDAEIEAKRAEAEAQKNLPPDIDAPTDSTTEPA
jgi:hypothetical protein